jgi:hypothetical protein
LREVSHPKWPFNQEVTAPLIRDDHDSTSETPDHSKRANTLFAFIVMAT